MKSYALFRLASVLVLSSCASCIWYPDRGLDGGIRAESRAALVPGRATREDVLCELGAPNWASVDEKRFLYSSCEISSTGMIYLVADAVEYSWGKDHFLLFEFDDAGVLRSQCERTRGFSGAIMRARRVPDAAECEALFASTSPAPGS